MIKKLTLIVSLFFSVFAFSQEMPVDMRNAKLSELVHYVADTLGVSVYMDPAVDDKTVTFINSFMTDDDALWYLEKVVTQSGLTYQFQNDTIFILSGSSNVSPQSNFQPGATLDSHAVLVQNTEPLITEVIYLSRSTVAQARPIAHDLLQQHAVNYSLREGYQPPFSVSELPSGNGLLVTAYRYQLEHIRGVLKSISISEQQLSIQAIVYETTVDKTDSVGFQLALNGSLGLLRLGAASSSENSSFIADLASGELTSLFSILSSEAQTNVLSTPSITVTQGRPAYISVGQQVPFIVGSEVLENGREVQRIVREDIGLNLDVEPFLLNDGRIQITVKQSASTLAKSSVQAADLITNQRVLTTDLIVNPDQIYSLGGLIQENLTSEQSSIPFFSDIPFVGNAFTSDSGSSNRTMLNVLIKVSLI